MGLVCYCLHMQTFKLSYTRPAPLLLEAHYLLTAIQVGFMCTVHSDTVSRLTYCNVLRSFNVVRRQVRHSTLLSVRPLYPRLCTKRIQPTTLQTAHMLTTQIVSVVQLSWHFQYPHLFSTCHLHTYIHIYAPDQPEHLSSLL